MSLFLFGVSMGEVLLIFLVVLMLFGSKKIPDLARSLGKGMNEFRKATDEIKREFEQSTNEIKEEMNKVENEIRQNSNDIRDFGEDVYRQDYGASNASNDVYGLNKPEAIVPDNKEPIPDKVHLKEEKKTKPDIILKKNQKK